MNKPSRVNFKAAANLPSNDKGLSSACLYLLCFPVTISVSFSFAVVYRRKPAWRRMSHGAPVLRAVEMRLLI